MAENLHHSGNEQTNVAPALSLPVIALLIYSLSVVVIGVVVVVACPPAPGRSVNSRLVTNVRSLTRYSPSRSRATKLPPPDLAVPSEPIQLAGQWICSSQGEIEIRQAGLQVTATGQNAKSLKWWQTGTGTLQGRGLRMTFRKGNRVTDIVHGTVIGSDRINWGNGGYWQRRRATGESHQPAAPFDSGDRVLRTPSNTEQPPEPADPMLPAEKNTEQASNWQTVPFPTTLLGNWYSDSGIWILGINNASTIRTDNKFYQVVRTQRNGELYRVITVRNGAYHAFFAKQISSAEIWSWFEFTASDTVVGAESRSPGSLIRYHRRR